MSRRRARRLVAAVAVGALVLAFQPGASSGAARYRQGAGPVAGPQPERVRGPHWQQGATRDLGTLGGKVSRATDVSGSVVVGTSMVHGQTHAFAYDLAAADPHMVDLTPAPGDVSTVKVDDGLVAGTFRYQDSPAHAFVYDLTSATPRFVDLGTLPGAAWAEVSDVDGRVVVGTSGTLSDWRHAFAYDLSAAQPAMVDLGTLPGHRDTTAVAVSGHLVLATSDSGHPGSAAVLADLDAGQPAFRPFLDNAAFPTSTAYGLTGRLVIGSVTRSRDEHPFYLDLAAATPTPVVMWGVDGAPGATDGRFVVTSPAHGGTCRVVDTGATPDRQYRIRRICPEGLTEMSGGLAVATGFGYERLPASVFDVTDPRDGLVRLTSAPASSAYAAAIDGTTVVGSVERGSRSRAVAWTLRPAVSAIAMDSRDQSIPEGGTARVRVKRWGSTERRASVSYVVTWEEFEAVASGTFARPRGRLTFAPGQRVGVIRLRTIDDDVADAGADFLVSLSRARGAALGVRASTVVRIVASDVRVDLSVRSAAGGTEVGRHVVSASADHQTLRADVHRGQRVVFRVSSRVEPTAGAEGYPHWLQVTFRMQTASGLSADVSEPDFYDPGSSSSVTGCLTSPRGCDASMGYLDEDGLRALIPFELRLLAGRHLEVGAILSTEFSVEGEGVPTDRIRVLLRVVG